MMVKDVTKFHKCHLGDGGMLECACGYRVSNRILSLGRGGTPKFGVDVEWVYSTQQLGGLGACSPRFF